MSERYASFFEWSDKQRKELGIVEELIATLHRSFGLTYHSPRNHQPNPPDCVCLDAEGRLVAIEVTELVSQKAIELVAKGKDVVRNWRPGDLAVATAERLESKDGKKYHGGPYAEIIVALHTDEPLISYEYAKAELAHASFGPFNKITSAFLLLSYSGGSYPAVPLNVIH